MSPDKDSRDLLKQLWYVCSWLPSTYTPTYLPTDCPVDIPPTSAQFQRNRTKGLQQNGKIGNIPKAITMSGRAWRCSSPTQDLARVNVSALVMS